MAYNNYFPATYQQYYPTQPNAFPTYQSVAPTQPTQTVDTGIIWVSGIEGAKSYLVGAGRSVLLMDSEAGVFYLKSTDMSGMPQPLRIFDYTERTSQPQTNQIVESTAKEVDTSMFVTRDELEDRLAKLTKPASKTTSVAKG